MEVENTMLPVNVGIRLPKGRDIHKNMFLDIASNDDQETTLLTLPINAAPYVSKQSPQLRCCGNLSS